MGNAKSRHKPSVANENSANVISNCKRIQKTAGGRPEEQKFRKSTTTIASAAKYNKTEYQHSLAADDGQQQQQRRLKQSSVWSLGSLNWNLSFSGRNSLKQQSHNKSIRRSSFTAIQQRRSKTQWHKPLTNTIFSTHFKDTSRNKELHIEQLVAKGAYGVVFKVIDKEHRNQNKKQYIDNNIDDVLLPNGTYALKVLKKSKVIAENSVQQIKNEVDIQKVCGHYPFIVRQIDIWQNRHNLHILSEYVPNGELFSKICTFSLDLIRLYLAEIALALDFLHNAGIIYRDAKSENILLTHDYHLKLTDFGLSKWLRLGFTTKTMCGTLQYMAPEILQGLPYGHSADWWSLGVIVCQMFMDKTPDISTYIISSEQLIDSELNANDASLRNILPSEVEHLPYEGKDVLKRLLDLNPQSRLRSVRALQKIAMYKNFKINPDFVLNINPLDIIANDNIMICERNQGEESALADKAFRNF